MVRMDSRSLLDLARGHLNPQFAFLQGRIAVRGRTKYALRFNLLLDQLIRATVEERGPVAPPATDGSGVSFGAS